MSESRLDELVELVESAVREFCEEMDLDFDLDDGERTRLFGGSSPFSSLQLVGIVVSVEEAVADRFDVDVDLTDDRAMSRRINPYATVGHLARYVEELLAEAK